MWRLFRVLRASSRLDRNLAQDDRALRSACQAVGSGDWRPARDLLAGTRSDFDRRARYLWVLSEEAASTVPERSLTDPARFPVDTTAAWPDRWAAAEPDNPDALLMRARSLIARGWTVRSSEWASRVSGAAFAEFHRLLGMSVPLCDEVARIAPDDPTPWVFRLLLGVALSADRDEVDGYWAEVVRRDPLHREAHNFRLMYLCRKWSGSHEEMFGFARSAAASAPTGSPLHVLPIQANAEWAMWELRREGGAETARRVELAWRTDPTFHQELDNALGSWFNTGPRRHAMWYHDLNHLAYGLFRGNRHADAAPVFAAIGPYMEDMPWSWVDDGLDVEQSFLVAQELARRGARGELG